MKREVLLVLLFVSLFSSMLGQTKDDLQKEKEKAFNELKVARELMERTAVKRTTSVAQLRILQSGIKSRSRLIGTLEQEVVLIDIEIEKVKNISNQD